MSVYFHSSFTLNRERISGILNYLIKQPELSDEQIAKTFGYKAPFVKRYKSWLKKCGVIKNSNKIELTEYGKIIWKKDSKLKKEPTLWYMYDCLISSEENAESWNFFHHTFLPKNKSFSKAELSNALSMKLMAHNPSHFAKEAPMIKVITKVLIDSYISDKAFGPLNILESKDGIFVRKEIKNPKKWTNKEDFAELL